MRELVGACRVWRKEVGWRCTMFICSGDVDLSSCEIFDEVMVGR